MAENVQITITGDLADVIATIDQLKRAAAAAAEPVGRLKAAFADSGAAVQQSGAAALAAFRANLQRMVAEQAVSLRQALAYEIEYTVRHSAEERERLSNALQNDAATLRARSETYAELVRLSERYAVRIAQEQRRMAEIARREADRIALPYRHAFDEIGAGWRSAAIGLVEGRLSFRGAAFQAVQSVERGLIGMVQTTLSRAAAGPLAALLGQAAPLPGDGVGDVLGNAVGRWLFGAPQQLGAAATAANTAALAANTAAIGALTASLGASAVAGGAGALGGLGSAAAAAGSASAGAAAGGGGLFGLLGGLLAFAGGGIVPSAARGWALPNFPGARPALLHAREMVLPAPISEGLQQIIGEGRGGGTMHLHFHGPSDGPAVERWFTGLMARNPGVVRNMLRSNALTPRTI
jgi:hypothetical protein